MVHELLAGSGPWWAWTMLISGAVLLIVLLITAFLHLTDRL